MVVPSSGLALGDGEEAEGPAFVDMRVEWSTKMAQTGCYWLVRLVQLRRTRERRADLGSSGVFPNLGRVVARRHRRERLRAQTSRAKT